jgi:sulfur carrier protein
MGANPEITVKINGDLKKVPSELSVSGLLDHFGIRKTTAIVEHNRKVIDRARYEKAVVSDGDELEIVRFVGGG